MLPKVNEVANVKKTTATPPLTQPQVTLAKCKIPRLPDSPSKSSLRNRARKAEGAQGKDKPEIATAVRRSKTPCRTRSYEKNLKPDTAPAKKTTESEEKKTVRSKSASNSHKASQKEPTFDVLEKVAQISKLNATTPPKYMFKKERLNSKTDKTKLKGFKQLLPLCERELKKIESAWVNAVYCSLSMRANLIKFLVQSFPNVEKSQFDTEDKKLIQCFDQVKVSTNTEADNLLNIVKSLLAARTETKESYQNIMKNDKDLRKKIIQTGESCTGFKAEDPQKKKEASETAHSEKPQTANKKRESFLSYFSFASLHSDKTSKANETNVKAAPPTIVEENSETKSEVAKFMSLQEGLDALKAKYSHDNESYERKIKELETLLEEKIRTLKQEREVKTQLQACLSQFQAQQKRLGKTFGYEQLDYLMKPSTTGRDKKREDLWLTAIKLILKGFFIQLKNLEMERDRMLLQLQSNDTENFNTLAASIIHKDNFVKSIKQQMISINRAYQKRKNRENCYEK